MDFDMDKDCFGRTSTWTGGVRVELPPLFRGDGERPFSTWIKQFEAAVGAQARGSGSGSYAAALLNLLPTRLDGPAFLLWDSLTPGIKYDYASVKEKLQEAFGQKQFILYFQTCVAARPRQPNESLEIYAADISRLVAEAFPEYDKAARGGETFRRFLAGLDPALQAKCHEQGATDMEEALTVASRCERARQTLRANTPGSNYSSPHPATVATLNFSSPSPTNCKADTAQELIRVIERLTSRMDNLQSEVRELRSERGSPFSGGRQRSPGERVTQRRACHCDCGGFGCRSASRDSQLDDRMRGRSPQRGLRGGYDSREWSPRGGRSQGSTAGFSPRRPDSEDLRGSHVDEERQPRRGVRFLHS